jgi:hypothetical protein
LQRHFRRYLQLHLQIILSIKEGANKKINRSRDTCISYIPTEKHLLNIVLPGAERLKSIFARFSTADRIIPQDA